MNLLSQQRFFPLIVEVVDDLPETITHARIEVKKRLPHTTMLTSATHLCRRLDDSMMFRCLARSRLAYAAWRSSYLYKNEHANGHNNVKACDVQLCG